MFYPNGALFFFFPVFWCFTYPSTLTFPSVGVSLEPGSTPEWVFESAAMVRTNGKAWRIRDYPLVHTGVQTVKKHLRFFPVLSGAHA